MEIEGRRSPPPPPSDLHQELGFQENTAADALVLEEELGFQETTAAEAEAEAEPQEEELGFKETTAADADAKADEEPAAADSGVAGVLTDDLRDKIVRQVEYYFSDENLPTDKFLLKYVTKNKEGFVPISVIASFRKMRKLVQDISLVEAALRTSSQLVLSVSGKKVRRLHPLPVAEVKDTKMDMKADKKVDKKAHTVIVENLPDDYTTDNLQKIFANVGKIVSMTIYDANSAEESAMIKKTEMTISKKLHALIEYETIEEAANAVATLNDEKNWRSGLRVEILLKRMGKYGAYGYGHNRRGQKENASEKNDNKASDTPDEHQLKSDGHHDEKAAKEEEDHRAGGKGKRRGQYKSHGRGHQSTIGQGHGLSDVVSKPLPGPKMPDGTRGFTMGRGKPAIEQPNPHDA